MSPRLWTTSLVPLLCLTLPAWSQTLDSTGVRAVPTYEAVGLYWSNPGASATGCEVRFRKLGDTAWRDGLTMWFDAASAECRGSLVGLAPGSAYEAQLNLPGQPAARGIAFTTWSNTVPVAQTIQVPSGTATLNITTGGTAAGYVVYDGTGSTLDAQNAAATNISINASYVVVRGFTLKNAQQHGILIDKNQHDVIVEDNDISGWGRTRDGTWGTDMDSGIRAICTNEELTRVTIQRNRIHDPRYPANSWAVAHPAGPQGITFSYCGGNNVYRWNEIYSAKNHYNDGMGGEDNFSTSGFPNKDSDVYGNRVEMAWDDGLEIEGGDQNVRVWGNYLNNTGTGISSTIDSVGPLYIFRNVWNRNQFIEGAANDSDQKQPMFKDGSSASFGNGRRYLFHNTMLQAQCTGCQYGMGGGAGIGGTGDTQLVHNTVSMNNIYHLWKPNSAVYQVGTDNTFQNDMFNGRFDAPIVGGINATPQYASGNGWQSESGGMYQLAAGTPGFDAGVRIANFNDDFLGAAPDVGAAESGAAPMVFGVAASTYTPSTTPAAPVTPPPPSPTPPPPSTTPGAAPMSATMDSSAYSSVAGSSVTFTAAVMGNSGTATGTIAFKADGTLVAGCESIALASGKALCATAALAAGSHQITGDYSGDATYASGTAGPITQTITAPVTAPTLPASFGMDASSYTFQRSAAVTFTAYIPGAGGTVNFTDNGNAIAGCGAVAVLANGIATCTTKRITSVGSHAIRGIYSGTPSYSAGVAGPITVKATK